MELGLSTMWCMTIDMPSSAPQLSAASLSFHTPAQCRIHSFNTTALTAFALLNIVIFSGEHHGPEVSRRRQFVACRSTSTMPRR